MSAQLGLVLQLLGTGVVMGGSYALVSLGLTLVYGTMRVINFAHGEFYMLSAFIAYTLTTSLGAPYLLAVLGAMAAVALIGLGISALLVPRLTQKHETAMLLGTLGLSQLLLEGAQLVWSPEPRNIPTPFQNQIVALGPIAFTHQQLLTLLLSALATCLLFWYVRYTTGGKLMQSVAQNRMGAVVCGVNISSVYNGTFAVGCALAALAGSTIGATTTIYPQIGQPMILKAFVVLILGGMGSVPGAVVGGLLLGIVEALGGGLLSVEYQDGFGYVLLILTLLIRPSGIFGKEVEL